MIVIGVVSILAVSSLQQTAAAGGDTAAFVPVGIALVDVRHWTMVIGPSMAGFNASMFGTLLYRSRLVPRAIPALGLVGAPLITAWAAGAMIGITETQHGMAQHRRLPVLLLGTGHRPVVDLQGLQPARADRGRRDGRSEWPATSTPPVAAPAGIAAKAGAA